MSNNPDIFIGITSWNSELFLGHCLRALHLTSDDVNKQIVVLDNSSGDRSADIARDLGATVIVKSFDQADALNYLFKLSKSRYTLLMHSDVIMLSDKWFPLCISKVSDNVALVSPEDIGCGPYTRPFGIGMPESSFLFCDTNKLKKTAFTLWRQRYRVPVPHRVLDFYGEHITHNIPARLAKAGLTWFAMNVHVSDNVDEPIYQPGFSPRTWSEELAHLRYGLGNFYSIDGVITHYHNWFDRAQLNVPNASHEEHRCGIPLAYIRSYTEAFLSDFIIRRLIFPSIVPPHRTPKSL